MTPSFAAVNKTPLCVSYLDKGAFAPFLFLADWLIMRYGIQREVEGFFFHFNADKTPIQC